MIKIPAPTKDNKKYELCAIKNDPAYSGMVSAIEIVKEFIIDKGLILYGGTAIDFALRLFGDKIYPDSMLQVPDLDFFSPQAIKDSYELADILYKAGYQSVRAINALHTTTMKVDLVDNHYIADISYVPDEIFNKLPTLEYAGMKIIHPNYQKIDMHLSLCFPYANAPKESVFERWEKDMKRLAKLEEYYKITASGADLKSSEAKWPKYMQKYVMCGYPAYALLYQIWKNSAMGDAIDNQNNNVFPAKFEVKPTEIVYEYIDGPEAAFAQSTIIHHNPEECISEFKTTGVVKYEQCFNMFPERYECHTKDIKLTIYSSKSKLVSVNKVAYGGITFMVANIQYLMWQFLSLYHISNDSSAKNTYGVIYNSLLEMSKLGGELFRPSIDVYGTDNTNTAREIILNKLLVDIEGAEPYHVPTNYYPSKLNPPPEFDLSANKFFQISGKKLN